MTCKDCQPTQDLCFDLKDVKYDLEMALRAAKRENKELQRKLNAALGRADIRPSPTERVAALGLGGVKAGLLKALLEGGVLTHERAVAVAMASTIRSVCPSMAAIRVHISNTRRSLDVLGVGIISVKGVGWRMHPRDISIVQQYINLYEEENGYDTETERDGDGSPGADAPSQDRADTPAG